MQIDFHRFSIFIDRFKFYFSLSFSPPLSTSLALSLPLSLFPSLALSSLLWFRCCDMRLNEEKLNANIIVTRCLVKKELLLLNRNKCRFIRIVFVIWRDVSELKKKRHVCMCACECIDLISKCYDLHILNQTTITPLDYIVHSHNGYYRRSVPQ